MCQHEGLICPRCRNVSCQQEDYIFIYLFFKQLPQNKLIVGSHSVHSRGNKIMLIRSQTFIRKKILTWMKISEIQRWMIRLLRSSRSREMPKPKESIRYHQSWIKLQSNIQPQQLKSNWRESHPLLKLTVATAFQAKTRFESFN